MLAIRHVVANLRFRSRLHPRPPGPTAGDGGANTKPITDSGELCDVVLNFIIAGRDTTACTLSWTFYQLSQNPAVQQVRGSQINCLRSGGCGGGLGGGGYWPFSAALFFLGFGCVSRPGCWPRRALTTTTTTVSASLDSGCSRRCRACWATRTPRTSCWPRRRCRI